MKPLRYSWSIPELGRKWVRNLMVDSRLLGHKLAVMMALLAIFLWLRPSAEAVDLPTSNTLADAHLSKSMPAGQTNATVRLVEAPMTGGKSGDFANAPATAENVTTSDLTNTMDTLDDRHKLMIGDRLSFRIIDDEDDPREISVTDSGELELPYIGRFPAVGETCKSLARKLKTKLDIKYYYNSTVIIALNQWAKTQGNIYIVGPVRSPGPQEIPNDEIITVSKAILRAGGFQEYADKHKVELRRKSTAPGKKDQVFIVDVQKIQDKGKSELDLPLEVGDIIYVPERSIRF